MKYPHNVCCFNFVTRKPLFKVALTTLTSFLADDKF